MKIEFLTSITIKFQKESMTMELYLIHIRKMRRYNDVIITNKCKKKEKSLQLSKGAYKACNESKSLKNVPLNGTMRNPVYMLQSSDSQIFKQQSSL